VRSSSAWTAVARFDRDDDARRGFADDNRHGGWGMSSGGKVQAVSRPLNLKRTLANLSRAADLRHVTAGSVGDLHKVTLSRGKNLNPIGVVSTPLTQTARVHRNLRKPPRGSPGPLGMGGGRAEHVLARKRKGIPLSLGERDARRLSLRGWAESRRLQSRRSYNPTISG
jgi:hypothetical protein